MNLPVTQKEAGDIPTTSSECGPPLHPQKETRKNVIVKVPCVFYSQLASRGHPLCRTKSFFRVSKNDSGQGAAVLLAVSGEDGGERRGLLAL